MLIIPVLGVGDKKMHGVHRTTYLVRARLVRDSDSKSRVDRTPKSDI